MNEEMRGCLKFGGINENNPSTVTTFLLLEMPEQEDDLGICIWVQDVVELKKVKSNKILLMGLWAV